MDLMIICFALTNLIPLHKKVVKNKGMIFDFFGKKHITEALFLQIRFKKHPYSLSLDDILNIFHYNLQCHAMCV